MAYKSLVISSGHGLKVRGAAGPAPWGLDEVNEARKVVETVAQKLRSAGVGVVTFHDDKSTSQNQNLQTIVGFHNAQKKHELDVSIHFNAFEVTTTTARGVEVCYLTQLDLAAQMSAAMAKAGHLINRGAKKRTELYFLNQTTAPAVLVETVFVDAKPDCDLYRKHYDAICSAIAETLAGKPIGAAPPAEATEPIPLPPPVEPAAPEQASRPTLRQGDYGYNVRELQGALQITVDGDFGPQTKAAVEDYQSREKLSVDGVVGPETWAKLAVDFSLPAYPPPLPPVFPANVVAQIAELAVNHPFGDINWRDRGLAPSGYVKGIAVAYAQAYARLKANDPIALEMAKADSHDEAFDALSWYSEEFANLGMNNDAVGTDTLRHLYVLLAGLGMRESSGQHCCGRDQSANNTDAETCEAGLYQTSFNARSACVDFENLFDQYRAQAPDYECPQGYLELWEEEVECSSSHWKSYGSGDGFVFQELAKHVPTFAVETCAITLRNLRKHYGPINRKEAELRKEAEDLFKQVEEIVDGLGTGEVA